jgi:ribulose-5-phosphate 4-epimerase/fuculose-1-phosphate aldolase
VEQSDVLDSERQLRIDLAACYRLVARYGWDDLLATHISVRLPGEGCRFLINPYGMQFCEITASSLVEVDEEGRVLSETKYAINPAGLNIHAAIHEVRCRPLCVIHLHANAGVAVSALECGLLPLSQTAMAIYHAVAYHDYEGFATQREERAHLRRDIGDKSILILRNHGTLITAPTVAEAFARAVVLEKACDIQLRAMATGQKLTEAPPDAIMTTYNAAMSSAYAGHLRELLWPSLLRMLDRSDDSYRQ